MTARFPVHVARFAVPVREGAQLVLDELGMLATSSFPADPSSDLVDVEALASAGSLCLLGEPGAGKTTALQDMIAGLPSASDAGPGQDAVHQVSLAEVTDREAFRELVTRPVLDRVPSTPAARSGGRLTVVLDALDECPLPGPGKVLAGLISELLAGASVPALRILVGCRAAEYPAVVHDLLSQMLPPFGVYELAPLSRRNVRELAASRGADPDAFLAAVVSSGTGPLASLPLTLDLLLRQHAETSGLHGPASTIYDAALRALAGEPDPDRAPSLRPPASGEQLLTVAARLCCYLLLCGGAAFWTGPAGLMPAGDLEPSELAGGEELQTGGAFPVRSLSN